MINNNAFQILAVTSCIIVIFYALYRLYRVNKNSESFK